MNKRMMIGVTGMAFDVLGMGEIIIRYQEYSRTGAYPQPDIGNMMLGELIKWIVLGVISGGFFVWGWFGRK